jgi:hypothetical protein
VRFSLADDGLDSEYSPDGARNPSTSVGGRIYADDGTYLGRLNANWYDPESLCRTRIASTVPVTHRTPQTTRTRPTARATRRSRQITPTLSRPRWCCTVRIATRPTNKSSNESGPRNWTTAPQQKGPIPHNGYWAFKLPLLGSSRRPPFGVNQDSPDPEGPLEAPEFQQLANLYASSCHPMLGFSGVHAGLCRLLLAQMLRLVPSWRPSGMPPPGPSHRSRGQSAEISPISYAWSSLDCHQELPG